LPVLDLRAALAHYASLGFRVRAYDNGEDYAFVSRNGVELHLTYQPTSSYADGAIAVVYLSVEDADALYLKWTKPGVGGQTARPAPMPWGMHEGTHTDLDGNVIRFGSPIEREPPDPARAG
jgi:predicted lactoylglutathione lyase